MVEGLGLRVWGLRIGLEGLTLNLWNPIRFNFRPFGAGLRASEVEGFRLSGLGVRL